MYESELKQAVPSSGGNERAKLHVESLLWFDVTVSQQHVRNNKSSNHM